MSWIPRLFSIFVSRIPRKQQNSLPVHCNVCFSSNSNMIKELANNFFPHGSRNNRREVPFLVPPCLSFKLLFCNLSSLETCCPNFLINKTHTVLIMLLNKTSCFQPSFLSRLKHKNCVFGNCRYFVGLFLLNFRK